MDRNIVYVGAIPQDTDILNPNKNGMIALGYALESAFGSVTFVSGLNCVATTPTADLNVHVQRGSICQLATTDGTAYGSIASDSLALYKQGINRTTTDFAITPPATAGYSQNYLIEAQLLESDATPIVLPYYNAATPSSPYSGPANTGVSQNTVRTQRVSLQLKAGVPFATGAAQNVPSTDSGWVALWIVSVANGQTQITSANIAMAPGAPFIGGLLTLAQRRLTGPLNLYVSTLGSDSNNGLLPTTAFATVTAAYAALVSNYNVAGQTVTINVAASTYNVTTLSGAPTGQSGIGSIIISGAGASTIFTSSGSAASLFALNNASFSYRNCTITGGFGVVASQGSILNQLDGVVFGACTNAQMYANGGQIFYANNYGINGGATAHWSTSLGGVIGNAGSTAPNINIVGTPAFSFAFATATSGQIAIWNGGGVTTFYGSATGAKFNCTRNGGVDTNTANINLLPGSIAGTTGSGTNTGFYA